MTCEPCQLPSILPVYKNSIYTADQIIDIVKTATSEMFLVTVDDLNSHTRKRNVTDARHFAMKFLYEAVGKANSISQNTIGESFGGRDHSTVIHARKKINELKSVDVEFSERWAAYVYNMLQKIS